MSLPVGRQVKDWKVSGSIKGKEKHCWLANQTGWKMWKPRWYIHMYQKFPKARLIVFKRPEFPMSIQSCERISLHFKWNIFSTLSCKNLIYLNTKSEGANVLSLTVLYIIFSRHTALDAVSSLYFSGFLLPQEWQNMQTYLWDITLKKEKPWKKFLKI